MPAGRLSRQRDYMRELVGSLGYDQIAVCAAYADAETDGLIARASNIHGKSAEQYALALWRDGLKKGWLGSPTGASQARQPGSGRAGPISA